MFSQTVEYSLRAVAHLAMKAPELVCVREMAEAIRLPEAYLAKVMQKLSEANIIVTRHQILNDATSPSKPLCEFGRQSMISLGLGRTNDAKPPLP